MQVAISIDKKLFPVQTTVERDGAVFPYEVQGYAADFAVSEKRGGFFDFSPFGVVQISGRDATDYLQRMSSLNVKNLPENQVALGALLTAKAHVVSLGFFQKEKADSYQLVVAPALRARTLEHLEQFHFGEALEIKDLSSDWAVLAWLRPDAAFVEQLGIGGLAFGQLEWRRWQSSNLEIWRDGKIPDLFWLKVARTEAEKFMFELGRLGVSLLGLKTFDYWRAAAGRAWVGIEITERDIILEANLDDAISRNKGCYPGQEVVERIFTYGQVNRKLLRLELESSTGEYPATPFSVEGWGEVVFIVESPSDPKRALGLGFIKKAHWEKRDTVSAGEIKLRIA